MKTLYALFIGFTLLLLSSTTLQAQCTGGRYHDFIFPGTPAVTSNVQYGSNIKFDGSTQTLLLDVYQPSGDANTSRALVIIAHGGGFTSGSKTDAGYVALANAFAQMGFVAVSMEYRLGFEQTGLAAQWGFNSAIMRGMHDARAAVRFMRDNALNGGNTYKIDPNNIYMYGVSAGAIMALHLAYQNL